MTIVGTKPPKDGVKNEGHLELEAGKKAMKKAKSLGSDILVLPAGFLVSNEFKSLHEIVYLLIGEARCLDLAVVFGADFIDKDEKARAYGYAWSPLESITHSWEQLSATCRDWNERPAKLTDDQWESKLKLYDDPHLLTINGGVVGVLICGELFNKRILDALVKKKPKIVVDLIHRGSGFRSTGAMKKLCHNGIASACSAHVQKGKAMKRCYIPSKGSDGNVSTRNIDCIIEGSPRIELKLFEVT